MQECVCVSHVCVCVCVYTGQNKQRDLRLLHLGLCPERLFHWDAPPSLFSPPYLSVFPTGSLFAALYTRAFLNQVGDGDKDTTKASNNNKRQLYWFLPTHTYTDTKTDRQADTRIDTYKTYLLRRCVCVRTAVYSSESQHVCMCVYVC